MSETKKLTGQDYIEAAKRLNCEVAKLRAVATVESSGKGFDDEGRLILRYEGHVFRKYTYGKFDKSQPHLSYPYRLMSSKRHGYGAFSEAMDWDATACLLSTSYGMFQPMGFTFDESGFEDVHQFVDFLKISEGNQLKVFVEMIKFRRLDDELRRGDWAGFARAYNGRSYKDNNYDVKMANAYRRFRNEPTKLIKAIEIADDVELTELESPAVVPATLPPIVVEPQVNDLNQENPADTTTAPGDPASGGIFSSLDKYSEKFDKVDSIASKVSASSWAVTVLTKLAGLGLLVWSLIINNPVESVLAVLLIVAAIWYLTQSKNRGVERAKFLR